MSNDSLPVLAEGSGILKSLWTWVLIPEELPVEFKAGSKWVRIMQGEPLPTLMSEGKSYWVKVNGSSDATYTLADRKGNKVHLCRNGPVTLEEFPKHNRKVLGANRHRYRFIDQHIADYCRAQIKTRPPVANENDGPIQVWTLDDVRDIDDAYRRIIAARMEVY